MVQHHERRFLLSRHNYKTDSRPPVHTWELWLTHISMQATAVFYQPSLPQKLQQKPPPSQQPGVQQTMQLRFIPATVHLCKAEEDAPVARHRQPTLSAADRVEDHKVEARSVTKSVCLLLCLALGEISLVQGCLNSLQVCNDHSQNVSQICTDSRLSLKAAL